MEFIEDTKEKLEKEDKRTVTNTLKSMGLNINVEKVERIGVYERTGGKRKVSADKGPSREQGSQNESTPKLKEIEGV